MNQRVINLSVQGSVIKYAGEAVGASGSHNSIVLRVEFDDQWADTTKSAYFTDALGEKTVEIVLGLNSLVLGQENVYDVPVPFEAMKYPGHAIISFKGTVTSEKTVSKAITTAFGKFRVYDSAIPEYADNAGEITPDTATQLQAEIDALKDLFSTAVEVSNEAKQAAQNAAASAYSAQTSKTAAETAKTGAEESATLSKSWAVGGTGTRPGEDTNNAEYWAGQAAAAAGGGVISFNGRTGTVLPQEGDYDADKVGAANKALSNLDSPQLALANLGGRPNPNLLDNWYFVGGGSQKGYGIFPVNQRGQNKYDQADGNCIDRNYKSSNAVVELLQDCIKVTLKANEAPNRFAHRIFEALVEGETYTISILIKSVSSEINVFVQESGGEFTTPVLETFSGEGMFSATFVCTKSAQYQVIISNESKIEIEVEIIAGKLEIGEKQTLAYQKDGKWILFETPDFRETLARCQRCLYIAALSTLSTYYYASVVPTSGDIFFPVIVPETMRAVPVISAAQATLYVGDATKIVTGITCYALRGNQALCRANGVATTASVKTGIVEIGGLQLSAEL